METVAKLEGSVQKLDLERQMAFGLASVVSRSDGEPLVDAHGDVIEPFSLEESVYDYVLYSRDADVMHVQAGIGRLVESMVITPEKVEAIGKVLGIEFPADVPTAWWVGFKVDDPEVWQLVKTGTLSMFSITGEGRRLPIDA